MARLVTMYAAFGCVRYIGRVLQGCCVGVAATQASSFARLHVLENVTGQCSRLGRYDEIMLSDQVLRTGTESFNVHMSFGDD